MGLVGRAIDRIAIESDAESLDYKTRLVFEIVAMGACDRDFGKQSKIVLGDRKKMSDFSWQCC
jgi:hypothetical protein